MRIRKIEADWGSGRRAIDLRGAGGYSLPLVGIVGNNGSGKTLLMKSVVTIFRKSVNNTISTAWEQLNATV